MSGYGAGHYGDMPYGDDEFSLSVFLQIVSVLAIRENVVQVQFNLPVYYTTLLDLGDASNPALFAVTAVSGTVGLDGSPVTTVRVASVAQDKLDPSLLELTLDRPMTAYGSVYTVSAQGIFSADLSAPIDPSIVGTTPGLFKQIVPPSVDLPTPNRDMANPQTLVTSLPNPLARGQLGVFVVDDTGDYTTDEGLLSLKKRIWRRVMSKKGGFLHLGLGYGVGLVQQIKRLSVASKLQQIAADCESQIAQEPDVQEVACQVVLDQQSSGLVRLNVNVRTRSGKSAAFAFGLQQH